MPYSLPRRNHRRSSTLDTPRRPTKPSFHFDDHSSSSSSDDDVPALKQKQNTLIPFPRSSPISPPLLPSRSSSTPILLSNGKPLKSSLKSSSSSPSITTPTTPTTNHTRCRSVPSSPTLSPKNVHFPSKEQGGLETIRLFSRSAKPASIGADDTETETDSESYNQHLSRGFPFPRFSPPPPPQYELDTNNSSPIPAPNPSPFANVHLESLSFTSSLAIKGTLLVRNLAYQKTVAVRFTLDEWHTTSEVSAKYVQSLPALPEAFFSPGQALTDEEVNVPAWDRFGFVIRLEDYARTLDRRTMWLVVRYVVPVTEPLALGLVSADTSAGEWWDNNGGNNFKVGFREGCETRVATRRTVVSAPSSFHGTSPPPSTTINTPSPLTTRPIPAPDSPHNSALTHTTMSRLRKLSLTNYAKPSPTSLIQNHDQDETDKDQVEEKTPIPVPHVEGWDFSMADPALKKGGARESAVASADTDKESGEGERKDVGKAGGVSLYWPWGTSSPVTVKPEDDPPSDTPTPKPTSVPPKLTLRLPKHTYSPRRSSPLASPRTTPPGSPLVPSATSTLVPSATFSSPDSSAESIPDTYGAPRNERGKGRRVFPPETDPTPLAVNKRSGSPIVLGETEEKEKEKVDSDSPPPSPSSVPSLSSSSSSSSLDTDSVYQAFVKKWCFAGGPTPPPGSSPPSRGNYELVLGAAAGVGVGVSGTPRMGVSPSITPIPDDELGVGNGARKGRERIVGF